MKKYISFIFIIIAILFVPIVETTLFAKSIEIEDFDFSSCTNFAIQSETEFYCYNSSTNQIIHYTDGNISSFGESGDNVGQFSQVQALLVQKNGGIVIYDKNLNKLLFFSSNFTFLNEVRTIKMSSTLKSLENVTDIISDIYSNVYLIDSSLNLILKANSTSTNFEIISQSPQIENAKFAILNNKEEFIIQSNLSLFSNNNSITLEFSPKSIFMDAKNFIYLVFDNKIEKYDINLTFIENISIQNGQYFSINLETGTIYYLYNNQIVTIENFATNIENATPPINAFDKIPLESSCQICTVLQNISLLNNPYSNKAVISLNKNEQVVLLASSNSFETNYCYVLYSASNQNYFGYIQQKYLSVQSIPEQNLSLVPTRNDVNYYKYPNSNDSFKISNLSTNQTYQSTKIITVNNKTFYEIKLNETFVYCQNFELIDENEKYIKQYLITNATIAPINGQNVLIYTNLEKTEILTQLSSKTNVNLISNNNEIAEIEFMFNNSITKGYIDSKFIEYKNDFTIPLTITLSLICVIVLVIIAIKFKKDKSKNKIITSYQN